MISITAMILDHTIRAITWIDNRVVVIATIIVVLSFSFTIITLILIGPQFISTAIAWHAEFSNGTTAIIRQLPCSLPLVAITCSAACLCALLQIVFRQAIDWLLHGFKYDPGRQIYSRYDFEPSTSPLLRLPAEVRLLIWKQLLSSDSNLVVVEGSSTQSHLSIIAKQPLLDSSASESGGSRVNHTYMRTCRQMYAEMGHLFYTSASFNFDHPALLVRFTEQLNLVQRRNVGKLQLDMDETWFQSPENRGPDSAINLTLNSLAIRYSLDSLPRLRKFRLTIWVGDEANDGFLALSASQILSNVNASRSVQVVLLERRPLRQYYEGESTELWKLIAWPDGSQKQFADAVSVRIRHPDRPLPKMVAGGKTQLKYRLFLLDCP